MRRLVLLAILLALLTGLAAAPVPAFPAMTVAHTGIGQLAYTIMADYPQYRCFTFTSQSSAHPENFQAKIVCFVEVPDE